MGARIARAIVRGAALLVPGDTREEWIRQWNAEIDFRRSRNRPVAWFAMGSLRHAMHRRIRAWRGGSVMRNGMGRDVRYALRGLRRKPGFTVLAVGTLAVGIGATTAVFSLAEALLLRPVPLPDGHRLVQIFSSNPSAGMQRFSVSYPDFRDLAGRADLVESAAVFVTRGEDLAGGDRPVRISVASVGTGFFEVLGTPAVIGRTPGEEEHQPTAGPTVTMSRDLWIGRFGGDPEILGRTVRLDGVSHTVIGVVDPSLAWPQDADVWVPLGWGAGAPEWADSRSNHSLQVVAKLAEDISARDASEQFAMMLEVIYSEEGATGREAGTRAVAVPLRSAAAGDETGPIFGLLTAAVAFVLLIACLNAAGLLLTRAWARTRELSLRAALGAGRGRLVSTLLTETAVLTIGAGILGVTLGHILLKQAAAFAPAELTALQDIRLNATVLLAATGISVVAAILAGLAPALRASHLSIATALRDGGGQGGTGRSGTGFRRVLVVAELSLALGLLAAAGLSIRGFQQQLKSDPGFDPSNLLTFSVRLPAEAYESRESVDGFYQTARERLMAIPGVDLASITSRLPLGGGGMGLFRSFTFDEETSTDRAVSAGWIEVDESYAGTLGFGPLEGRLVQREDGPDDLIAVVNESMAQRLNASGSVVGRSIRSVFDENLGRTVVGVVPDIQMDGLAGRSDALVYVPARQSTRRSMAFMLRTREDPSDVVPAVRSAMSELDPNLALDRMRTLRDAHRADLAGVRFLTLIFGTFGVLALGLSVSGVYGLVSFSVDQRLRDFGIRMAMGASGHSIQRDVVLDGGVLAAAGLVIGAGLAFGLTRLITAVLADVFPLDPTTIASAAVVLFVAVVVASWAPALRAARVDPCEALRSE